MDETTPTPGQSRSGRNVRAAAANALTDILDRHRTLDEAITRHGKGVAQSDQALMRELVAGTCRWFHEADSLLTSLLEKPLKAGATPVKALLLIGIYQLLHMRIPAHAVINESVRAVKQLRQAWATGLANAVLRKVSSDTAEVLEALPEHARLAHPRWLIKSYREHWPAFSNDMIAAANDYPPMTLRVNQRQGSRDHWLAQAAESGLNGRPGALSPCAVTLEQPVSVDRLPGFYEGRVSVQDEAAQLCAALLSCEPGNRVLDACAAPGGKTGHLLETSDDIALTALDVSSERLARVADNLSRLQLHATLINGDACTPMAWWDGQPFQRILVDAPCSGTGVIRRHPDIKILRKPAQIDALNQTQAAILDALWPTLAQDGLLLYATCSILPAENEDIVAAFCRRTPNARTVPVSLDQGTSTAHGYQLLPSPGGTDGFFYALLRKA